MSLENDDQLPSKHTLDSHVEDPKFKRAGNGGVERRIQDESWQMVEIVQAPNYAGTMVGWPLMSRRWLSAKDWSVILLPRDEEEDLIDPRIAEAVRQQGYHSLVGAMVDPKSPAPSAVWNFPPESYRDYLLAYTGRQNIVFPEDRRLALLSDDDDVIVVGGPADFIRDAVGGDVPAARRLFDHRHLHPDDPDGPSAWYIRTMAHYAPFLLER